MKPNLSAVNAALTLVGSVACSAEGVPVISALPGDPISETFVALGRSTSLSVCVALMGIVGSAPGVASHPPWWTSVHGLLDAMVETAPNQRGVPFPWCGYRTDTTIENLLIKSAEAAWRVAMTNRASRRLGLAGRQCADQLCRAATLRAWSEENPDAQVLRSGDDLDWSSRARAERVAYQVDPVVIEARRMFLRTFSTTVRHATAAR